MSTENDIDHKFELACDLYHKKHYESAKESFETLLSEGNLSADVRRNCLVNVASCLASLGNFRAALEIYNDLSEASRDIRYNRALCQYKLSNFEEALDILDDLLADHQETSSKIETVATDENLIKCLNLKSAIQFKFSHDPDGARELISSIQANTRDCIILHNRSIYASDIESAITSLRSLISEAAKCSASNTNLGETVPPGTVNNLMKLALIQDCPESDKLLDQLAKEDRLALSRADGGNLLELYEILASGAVSQKETCKKLDILLGKSIEKFDRRLDNQQTIVDLIELTVKQLTMILWKNNQYETLERILLKVEPILGDTNYWPIWFAHTLFMQDTRYEECCYLYEKLLDSTAPAPVSGLLAVDPIVVANLCVAYLLTGQNDSAESLIKEIEIQEAATGEKNKQNSLGVALSHSCIVNLTIGQLYCVKLNYNFGLLRIFRSLEPLEEAKLNSQTWSICKRCILSLLDNHCKSMIYVRDDLFEQVISFLIECERHGVLVRAATDYKISNNLEKQLTEHDRLMLMGRNSVTYEARYLRSLVLAVLHD